ncbi:MAG: redox-sensing transcriptional repressor Rex [Pirellula sp.]|nr:redox-sensing transcriptional repressor Rex [Pirellula sp.]
MAKPRAAIPAATVSRLTLYLRELQQMERSGTSHVRSGWLAERLGLNDSQVRRDLSCLGQVGQRGVGYRVHELTAAIQRVLGTDRSWNVILVGIGNLGRALSKYRGFDQQGFRLVAAFDSDPEKVGDQVGTLSIKDLNELEPFVVSQPVDLAILAVPASEALSVAAKLQRAGVSGILNFAPIVIPSNESLTVQPVDLALELQRLAYSVVQSKQESHDPKDLPDEDG